MSFNFFSILTLIGGLAMFLYGMDEMGKGLKKLSGGQLESILEKLTSNKYKGFLLGFFVTAIIQSSSATTVMLVGFVNSGIMKLFQTIGIIFGANVGTTVTSWIISLTGIQGDSFWIQIFKPSSFTPILAFVGILLLTVAKKDKHKDIGTIFIGFAVLMFGMETMSGAMEGLKENESFRKILIMFANPFMGVLVGTILTAIIQSSSASIGILQALSLTGAVPFTTALPIILGQNIGTTITPILSAINGNTGAKRVAIACLYIKLVSVVLLLPIFYLLNGFIGFSFMESTANPVNIAIAHTLFNVVSTVILLPFDKLFEKLAVATYKDKKETESSATASLDERFLTIPAFAIEKCRDLVAEMITVSRDSFKDALNLVQSYDKEQSEKIKESETLIDNYEDKLSTYLVKLASRELSQNESNEVAMLLHVIGDIERISDHSVDLVRVAEEIHDKKIVFSDDANHEISILSHAMNDILSMTSLVITQNNLELAKQIEPLEQVIDRIKYKMKANHIKRLQQSNCTIELGFVFSDFITHCGRASDHCSNIAACALEIANGEMDTHEYLNHVKNDGDETFSEYYQKFKQQYRI